jgi:hypothetical protein
MTTIQTDVTETSRPSPTEPPGPTSRGRDWQRSALIAGGIVFAVGNLLHPLEHDDAAYHSTTWQAAHITIFFSIVLLVLGLPYLHRQLTTRVSPRLATVAVAASVAGLIGIGPGCILEAFVAPVVGHHVMEELESGGMGVINGILGVAFLGGAITLGWALHRAGARPRWAGPGIIVSAVAMLGVMSATGPAAGVVIITATAVYGLALAAVAARPWPSGRDAA